MSDAIRQFMSASYDATLTHVRKRVMIGIWWTGWLKEVKAEIGDGSGIAHSPSLLAEGTALWQYLEEKCRFPGSIADEDTAYARVCRFLACLLFEDHMRRDGMDAAATEAFVAEKLAPVA